MLTGDKDKTAVTIAKNCGLTDGIALIEISEENAEKDLENAINSFYSKSEITNANDSCSDLEY